MSKRLTTAMAGLVLGAAILPAQETAPARLVPQAAAPIGGVGFQQASTLAPTAGIVGAVKSIAGHPFSATQESRTLQTLGDGTVLESSETSVLYRDNEGRTRVEQTRQGKTTISITDPVAGFRAILDPESKSVRKALTHVLVRPLTTTAAQSPEEKAAYDGGMVTAILKSDGSTGILPTGNWSAENADTRKKLAELLPAQAPKEAESMDVLLKLTAEMQAKQAGAVRPNTEDLGILHQNGVPAQGTRTTVVIPVGQIGNNREIRVVNERWYSADLQMVVRSMNSDPRFGTTTYEIKNILQTNPDARLFQIPGDYSVQEFGGRGGALKK